MIFELIAALGDGITFLFPFWCFGSKERHTQKAVFLIAVYSILNAYISMADLSNEVIRESMLIAISILLIWTYIGHLNADILFLSLPRQTQIKPQVQVLRLL